MNHAKTKLAAIAATCAFLASGPAIAGTSSTPMSVTAAVVAKCTVSAPTLAFGNYDIVTNLSSPATGSSTLTFTCTKGSPSVFVTADVGGNTANAVGTTRAMTDGSSDYLSYELYTDSGHTVVWNTTNSGAHTFQPTFAASHTATAVVYGSIPAAQDAVVGSYTDSISVVINY